MEILTLPIITYEGDGNTKVFSIPFDYLRKLFIKVSVDKKPTEDYIIEQRTIIFNTPPALGAVIRIERNTPTTRLVSWADASVLRAKDMNINDVQSLHLLEEQQIWIIQNAMTPNEAKTAWRGNELRIENVAVPVNPNDVVTKVYMEYVQDGFVQANRKIQEQVHQDAENSRAFAIRAEEAKQAIETLFDSFYPDVQACLTSAERAEKSAKRAEAGANTATLKADEVTQQVEVATTKANEALQSQRVAEKAERHLNRYINAEGHLVLSSGVELW